MLLEGEKATSLPPLLHGRVLADFRKDSDYFTTLFDLILSLYGIAWHDFPLKALRESLADLNILSSSASGSNDRLGLV